MAKDIPIFDNTDFANGRGKGGKTALPGQLIVYEYTIEQAKALAAIGEEYDGELQAIFDELTGAA